MDYNNYYPAIKKCKIFYELNNEEVQLALDSMNAVVKKYRKGEIIHRFGAEIKHAIVVLSGETRSALYEPIDHPFEIVHGTVGQICMLPGSIKNEYKSPIEIMVHKDAEILFLDIRRFFHMPKDENQRWHGTLMANIIEALADHSITLKSRIRIIAHKKIKDRIMLYLYTLPTNEAGYKYIPMSMSDLSKYLHVEKGAMYKTIKDMQAEGILEWDKRKVKLLIDK